MFEILEASLIYLGPLTVLLLLLSVLNKLNIIQTIKVCICTSLIIFGTLLLITRRPFALETAMNWQGQTLLSIFSFVAVLLLGKSFRDEVGVFKIFSIKEITLALAAGCLITAISYLIAEPMTANHFNEKLLFQMTLPGIGEELIFRGLLLTVFNRHFGKPFELFNFQFGWGVFLVSLPFALAHVFTPDNSQTGYIANFGIALYTFTASLLFAFLKEKTGSIWTATVSHNVANTTELIVAKLLS